MKTVHCPFCHADVDSAAFSAHEAEHLKLRPDGQLSEYVTLPPEERAEGSLEGVPQIYRHQKCGELTGMPEENHPQLSEEPLSVSGGCHFLLRLRHSCSDAGMHLDRDE